MTMIGTKTAMAATAALLLMMIAAPVQAQSQDPAPVQPQDTGFTWSQFPTDKVFGQYYPVTAAGNDSDGTVTLDCKTTDTVGHVACNVVSEAPEWCGNKLDYENPILNKDGEKIGYTVLRDEKGKVVPQPCRFGASSVRMVEKHGLADTGTGKVPVGTVSRVTLNWQMH